MTEHRAAGDRLTCVGRGTVNARRGSTSTTAETRAWVGRGAAILRPSAKGERRNGEEDGELHGFESER